MVVIAFDIYYQHSVCFDIVDQTCHPFNLYVIVSLCRLHIRTLSPIYNDFGCNEHPAITSRFHNH